MTNILNDTKTKWNELQRLDSNSFNYIDELYSKNDLHVLFLYEQVIEFLTDPDASNVFEEGWTSEKHDKVLENPINILPFVDEEMLGQSNVVRTIPECL